MGNRKGEIMNNLFFGQCDTVFLAEKYGTPLYLISEDIILNKINEIKKNFLHKYINTYAVYASKAFLTKEMARVIKREGLGMDVVSGGELYTALQVNFPMEKIIFHGNNKSFNELNMAIANDVGRIVVDNLYELELIEGIAKKYNKVQKILYRITPGVNTDTHRYIQTGQVDSKFGIPYKESILQRAIEKAMASKYVDLMGFHFHIGSQINDNKSYVESVRIIGGLIKKVKERCSFEVVELNVGGGFGKKPIDYFTDAIMKELEEYCKRNSLKRPIVGIEPGRWIIEDAGITLYTIGSIKEIPGVRTYVAVDGGMADNPRPSLYGAKYKGVIANKMDLERTEVITIAGKCCESGDILIWDLKTPKVEPGDILAVLSTGAYNYSMASNYNKLPKPAVVMCSKGKDKLIVKRETYEDMLRNEI